MEKFLERALTSTLRLALKEGRRVLQYILDESVTAACGSTGEAPRNSSVGGPHGESGGQRVSLTDDILETVGGEDHCITLTKNQMTGQWELRWFKVNNKYELRPLSVREADSAQQALGVKIVAPDAKVDYIMREEGTAASGPSPNGDPIPLYREVKEADDLTPNEQR